MNALVAASTLRLGRSLPALQHREFRRYISAQAVSVIGTWMQSVALAWLVYQLTGSPARLGIFGALGTLPLLGLGPFAGGLADRHSRRRVMLVTQIGMTVSALVLAAAHALGILTYPLALVLAAVQGSIFAFDVPSRHALVAELVDKRNLANAVALNSSIFNAARLIGPALAGVALIRYGATICFLLNGLSFLPVVYVLATMADHAPPSNPNGRGRGSLTEAVRYVAGEPTLRIVLALVGLGSIFGFSVGTLMPVFARDVFGRDAAGYGRLVASTGLGALIGALVLAFWGSHRRPKPFLVWGLGLMALGTLAVGRANLFSLGQLSVALAGFGLVVFSASSNSVVQVMVPDALRGRVMALWSWMFLGLSPLGSLQIGYLAEHFGPRAAVTVAGTVCLLAALLALARVPGRAGQVQPQAGAAAPQVPAPL